MLKLADRYGDKIQKTIFILFFISLFVMILSIPMDGYFNKSTRIITALFFVYLVVFHKYSRLKSFVVLYKDFLIAITLLFVTMVFSNILNLQYSQSVVFKIYLRYFFISLILLFFYYEGFFDKFGKKIVLIFVFISLSYLVFTGISQLFFEPDILKKIKSLIKLGLTGATSNRNVFGYFMAIGTIVAFYNFFATKKTNLKLLFFIFLIYFLPFLFFSYSRTAWMFVFVFLFSYFLLFFRNIQKSDLIFMLLLLAMVVVVFFAFDTLSNRFESLIEGNSNSRVEIWVWTIEEIKQKLFFGHGLNNFQDPIAKVTFPHNAALDILYSVGILGFVISSIVVYILFKDIMKNNKIFLPFLFGLFTASMFDLKLTDKPFLSTVALFMFFVLSERIDRIKKEDENKEKI